MTAARAGHGPIRQPVHDHTDLRHRGARPDAPEARERKLHVVTMVDTVAYGGAEHIAQWLAMGFASMRMQSTLAITRSLGTGSAGGREQAALEQLRAHGVHVLQLGRRHRLELSGWLTLTRFLRANRVDVLHAHKFGSNVWAALLGHRAGVPVVIAHEHSWGAGRNRLRRLLDRYVIAPRVDRFIAVSREDCRRMELIEGIDRAKICLLPNGIPAAEPTRGRRTRAELGISAAAPVVVTAASLRPVKAVDVLIRAAAELVASGHPDLTVLIAGGGPDRDALQQLIGRLDLDRRVRLLGVRADVADLLAAADVAVCCSDSEGSPISVLEYMQSGLPVVATAVGGITDLIEHDVSGLLVPPRNPEALASAIGLLLDDRERMRVMGARAQERQGAEYILSTLLRRVEQLYLELLACANPAVSAQATAPAGAYLEDDS